MPLTIRANSLVAAGEGFGGGNGIAGRFGAQVVEDFYLHASLMGLIYQVRAGTITTPLVGDVVLTDTAAEFCVDPASGYTLLPVYQNISIRLGTGTLHEYATKSVATASTAGTAFVLLPLRTAGVGGAPATAASSTARVSAAGGVTVTAEVVTTTRRHWSYSNPVVVGAGDGANIPDWVPRCPPPITSGFCLYTQIAATGTGPSYYANLDVIEALTASLF